MTIFLVAGLLFVVGGITFLFLSGKDKNAGGKLALSVTQSSVPAPLTLNLEPNAPIYKLFFQQTDRPFGIKFITFLNWVTIIANVIFILFLMFFPPLIPKMMHRPEMSVPAGLILFVTVLAGIMTFFLFSINQGLWNFKGWARIVWILVSIITLLKFPGGTILGGIYLYFLIIDPDVTVAFQKN